MRFQKLCTDSGARLFILGLMEIRVLIRAKVNHEQHCTVMCESV